MGCLLLALTLALAFAPHDAAKPEVLLVVLIDGAYPNRSRSPCPRQPVLFLAAFHPHGCLLTRLVVHGAFSWFSRSHVQI